MQNTIPFQLLAFRRKRFFQKHLVNKTRNEEVKQEEVSIVNATWVILEIDREEYDEESGKQISKHTRELITLKDPLSIKNLNVEQLD